MRLIRRFVQLIIRMNSHTRQLLRPHRSSQPRKHRRQQEHGVDDRRSRRIDILPSDLQVQ